MTTKNLEKLSKNGEKKLLYELNLNLNKIRLNLIKIKQCTETPDLSYLNEKIKSYKNLIANCKSYQINITEEERTYMRITNDTKKYLEIKSQRNNRLSLSDIRTQYELEECIN